MTIEKNTIVTVNLGNSSSNTFIVDTVEPDHVLVTHPLSPNVLLRVHKNKVNTTSANVKDSSERCIDYSNANKSYLDFNTREDLEGLALYFAMKRTLTPRQKQVLARITGVIAAAKFRDNVRDAMNFITKNSSILDDFNTMWFNNFQGLFNGSQQITSEKQRDVIFNMAGYVLAEMENPTARTRK